MERRGSWRSSSQAEDMQTTENQAVPTPQPQVPVSQHCCPWECSMPLSSVWHAMHVGHCLCCCHLAWKGHVSHAVQLFISSVLWRSPEHTCHGLLNHCTCYMYMLPKSIHLFSVYSFPISYYDDQCFLEYLCVCGVCNICIILLGQSPGTEILLING